MLNPSPGGDLFRQGCPRGGDVTRPRGGGIPLCPGVPGSRENENALVRRGAALPFVYALAVHQGIRIHDARGGPQGNGLHVGSMAFQS